MAQLPDLPSTGQPIDTQYIYSIVDSLYAINTELATSGTSYIDNGVSASTEKTAGLKITAKRVTDLPISNGQTLVSGGTNGTTIPFDNISFTKPPVVVASLVSSDIQAGNAQLILTISSITTSGFNWKTYCTVKGISKYDISYIAIGV